MPKAFIFTPNRTVKNWPATIKVAQDGGKVQEIEVELDLTLLPSDDYMKELSEGQNQLFDTILDGWHGINDADGNPLKDTKTNRKALYQHPPFTDALLIAYRSANSGEAARKNS